LAVVLGHFFGAGGIAAAIALGAWSTAVTLIRRGAETFGFSIDKDARHRLPRMVAAALVMGALLWLTARLLLPPAEGAHGLAQVAVLAILIGGGIAIYGLILRLFGITGWRHAVNALRQKAPADLRE
jgi:putative peptidoglycan lipid II flippase